MKTLAIRLKDEQHGRLVLLAKVSGLTITELIRSAIDARLELLTADSQIAEKAKAVLDDIDRQAQAERDAIATLIGDGTNTATKPTRATGKKPTA